MSAGNEINPPSTGASNAGGNERTGAQDQEGISTGVATKSDRVGTWDGRALLYDYETG
jgi:hypothetical protein